MRSRLKDILYNGLEYGGINSIFRKKNRRALLILTYHSVLPYSSKFESFDYRNCVSTERFDQQLSILKKLYQPLTLTKALARMQKKHLDGNEVVITFDDGFLNNSKYALPILQKHSLPAVFYISTAFIDKQEMLWTEKVNDIIMNAGCDKIDLCLERQTTLSLKNSVEREKASVLVRTFLKYQPWKIQEEMIRSMIKTTGYNPNAINADPDRYVFMDWNDVCALDEAGMEIGSHTHNHLLLNMLNPRESFWELRKSRDIIENKLNKKCSLFSYPNGAAGNFSHIHYDQLKELGYSCAVTQMPGFNTPRTPVYALMRINITSKMDTLIFKACLSGSRNFLKL